jgi:hypothetical protein
VLYSSVHAGDLRHYPNNLCPLIIFTIGAEVLWNVLAPMMPDEDMEHEFELDRHRREEVDDEDARPG